MGGAPPPDHSLKAGEAKGASISHSSGGKIPYPKHVWSPAGGWYSQPANWRSNTAVVLLVVVGITSVVWKYSAENEHFTKMPEKGRFFPSRYWNKEIIEYERARDAKEAQERSLQK